MKKDKARSQTDARLKEIEARLRREYKQAHDEIVEKWNAYMKAGGDRVGALYNAYLTAPADKKAEALQKYQQAVENYTLGNEHFRKLEYETAQRITNVNQLALDYVNGQLPPIYSLNLNYEQPEFLGLGVSFELVNEQTIRRLIMNGDVKLPKKKVNVPKDIAWNTKQMSSAVLQGILQGESMDKIAKRLLPIVNNNEKAAIRNARTLVTGAENLGRTDRYKMLEKQGVVMYKMWIATGDGHTRDWHLTMDGQEVPQNEAFIDGLGNELEYPGDPSAEPETVYNCRCSMRRIPRGIRNSSGSVTWFDAPKRDERHVREIEDEKQERGL